MAGSNDWNNLPNPSEIENDEQMHRANAMIRGRKFNGQFNDPDINTKRGASNGSAFIECHEIPEKRDFKNKAMNGCMSIEYNLESGSIIYRNDVEFEAYYHKFRNNYNISMKKGTTSTELTPDEIIGPIDLGSLSDEDFEEEAVVELCAEQYQNHGFCILSRGSSNVEGFLQFAQNVEEKVGAKVLRRPGHLRKVLSGDVKGVDNTLKFPFLLKSLTRRDVKKDGYFADQFFLFCKGGDGVDANFRLNLMDAMNNYYSKIHDNAWVILADETGVPKRVLDGREEEAHIAFIAIPPASNTPTIHPEYHSNRRHWRHERVKALNALVQEEVRIYVFTASPDGTARKREGVGSGHGTVANANMWQCLYLVMEDIAERNKDPCDMHIYFERHTDVDPGSDIYQDQVSQFRDLLKNRPSWSNIHLPGGGGEVLAKGEHGWLSYPDVVGLSVREADGINVTYRNIEMLDAKVREKAIRAPYDNDSINKVIQAIRSSSDGKFPFLQSVLGLNEMQINNYATKFLRSHAKECINNLTVSEWTKFNSLAKDMMGESSECWRAYEFLMGLYDGGIERLTQELDGDVLLGALLGFLANANHSSDIEAAELAKAEIIKLIDSEQPVSTDARTRAINNLCVNSQNVFDFKKVDEWLSHRLVKSAKEDNSIESLKLRGTEIQNLAFLKEHEQARELWGMCAELWPVGEDRLRQNVYLAHILIDCSEYMEAQVCLKEAALEYINSLPDYEIESSLDAVNQLVQMDVGLFFTAAILKSVVQAQQNGLQDDDVVQLLQTESITRRISKLVHYSKHPVPTIWYWSIRFYTEQSGEFASLNEDIIQRFSVFYSELYQPIVKNAWGMMIGCYRLDLAARGHGDFTEAVDFFTNMLEQSEDTTRSWFTERVSEGLDAFCDSNHECDRLSPLTFNYL